MSLYCTRLLSLDQLGNKPFLTSLLNVVVMGPGGINFLMLWLGQAGSATSEIGEFPTNSLFFQFFSLRIKKKSHQVGSKNTRVKGQVSPLFIAGQKYARIESGQERSL